MSAYETLEDSDTALNRRFDVDRPVRVEIANHSGGVVVEAGPAGTVEVGAASPAGRELLDRVEIVLDGDVLRVSAPRGRRRWFGSSEDVSFRVVVPERSAVSAESESGELTLRGVLGDLDLRTASGQVRTDSAAVVRATSASGDVRIGVVAGDCRVSTASGDVEVAGCGGRFQVQAASGDVRVGTVTGALEVSTASGGLVAAEVGGDVRARTMSGDIRIRHAGGSQVQVTSASGDLEIGVPEGVAAWLDLTSASGEVASELPDVGEPAPGSPTVEIRAATASGDIRIHRA